MGAISHKPSPFYHHAAVDAYECLGCMELLEVPGLAVVRGGDAPVHIKSNPENRLLWLELMEIQHGKCASFHDVEKAKQYMEFGLRSVRQPRGDDGPRYSGTAPGPA